MNESIQAAEMMGSDVSDICGSGVGAPVHATERKVLAGRGLVSQIFTSWNQMVSWLRQLQGLRRAA
jgi:hypothetical protein